VVKAEFASDGLAKGRSVPESARGDAQGQGQYRGRGGEAGFAKREKCERCASANDVASLATAAPFGDGQATRRSGKREESNFAGFQLGRSL